MIANCVERKDAYFLLGIFAIAQERCQPVSNCNAPSQS